MFSKITPAVLGAAIVMALTVSNAAAINRYVTTSRTCNQVQAILQSEGAAILRWQSKRGLPIYDRFVASRYSCGYGQYPERKLVPTRDTPRCPAYVCKEGPEDRFIFDD